MKQQITKFLTVAFAVFSLGLLIGCNPEKTSEYSVSIKEVGPDYVDLYVTAPSAVEMAYVISVDPFDNAAVSNPAVLYMSGQTLEQVVSVNSGSVLRINKYRKEEAGAVRFLDSNVSYNIAIVSKLNSSTYSPITVTEFTTSAYNFSDVLTVVGTYLDGYKIHCTIPDAVKESDNALRYAMTNLYTYNMSKRMLNKTEFDMLLYNGGPDTRFIKNDTTFVVTNETIYDVDKDGNYVTDDEGNYHFWHMPVAPGEPSVFLVGEFRYGNMDENPQGVSWGSDKFDIGYVVPMLDWDTKEWTGCMEKLNFYSQQPTLLDAELGIDIKADVIDARITLTPGEGVYMYIPLILDVETYNSLVSLLDGDESLLQWYLTSYQATSDFIINYMYAEDGPISFNATEFFSTQGLKGNTDYYFIATVMGDEEGSSQRFYKVPFKTKNYTLGRPILEVTPYPKKPANPDEVVEGQIYSTAYEATFNIRLTNPETAGNLTGGVYACNYTREWTLMLNQGYTYKSILEQNYSYGYGKFTTEDLEAINSAEGLDIVIPTLDGEFSTLAVYGHNAEYTYNRLDPDMEGGCPAIAEAETPAANALPRVESDLFEKLPGEWTATATLSVYETDDSGKTQKYNHVHKTKVTISSTAPYIPDTCPDEVYDVYAKEGVSEETTKANVDMMFGQLKSLAERFTESRLTNQNSLLCTGFNDFDYHSVPGRQDTRTPWDLFTMTDYVSVDVAQLYYDFGPKWFLQVKADGSVVVPFNSETLPPLHSWGGYPNYIGGYDIASNNGFVSSEDGEAGFPVTVSGDYNTITIHPIERPKEEGSTEMVRYYPNAIGINNTSTELVAPIVSEVVLTRNWVGECPTCKDEKATSDAAKKSVSLQYGRQDAASAAPVYKSMTSFHTPVKYTEKEISVLTIDKFNEVMEKKRNEIRAKLNTVR